MVIIVEKNTKKHIFKKAKSFEGKTKDEKKTNNSGKLTKSLNRNITIFQSSFSNDDTVIFRKFQNQYSDKIKCCIIIIEGMTDIEHINRRVIEPLQNQVFQRPKSSVNLVDEVQNKVLPVNDVRQSTRLNEMIKAVCYGDTVLLLDGCDVALIISSRGWESRPISEPESGKVVRGPREGFTESIIKNVSLIRRKIKNPNLKFKLMELGKQTHTAICITYIEGIALDSILTELEQRLNRIDIDGILDSGYVQELIQDEPLSPFPTVGSSERPDVVVAKMLEGRVAIIVDGSPFVLTVPHILVESIQINEDYYNHFLFGSFNRFLRAASAIATISIPAVYLAIVTYHQEMIPTQLLISISASLEGVPLPTSLSLIIMMLIFDILREAGTRMPTAIGQAVNIVGTLVLGQAAVDAHLVSSPVIIVTAISGITTFMHPTMIESVVILRLVLIIAASFLGIYGYLIGVILILLHLLSIRSFGVPYMMGLTRLEEHDGQDSWIRAPWWSMTLRPKIIGARNQIRQTSRHNR